MTNPRSKSRSDLRFSFKSDFPTTPHDIVTALAFLSENATLYFVVSLPNVRTVTLPTKNIGHLIMAFWPSNYTSTYKVWLRYMIFLIIEVWRLKLKFDVCSLKFEVWSWSLKFEVLVWISSWSFKSSFEVKV